LAALLSLAMRSGITVAGPAEAIGRICTWLDHADSHPIVDRPPRRPPAEVTYRKDTMNDTITASPETLRAQMVDRIIAAGWARSDRVAEVMRTVPRHLFVPDATVDEAYDDRAVITKRAADGIALSCASEPVIVAIMLDQLNVNPGQRILEIGAGTGYNAALLADLTGPGGQVTTIDIDPEVTAQARHALDATGYPHVHVATRDGELGDPDPHHTTASFSPSTPGTYHPPGGLNSQPTGGSSCPYAGAVKPAASPAPIRTTAPATCCDPTLSS
jgi:protein-L-isoaspartate(D-aspartate) O-methyltransferase